MFDFKEFRKRNNFTQSGAAEYFGCKQSFISLIETNRSKVPSEFIIKILADPALDKSMLPEEVLPNLPANNVAELFILVQSQQRTIESLSETIKNLTSK